MRPLYNIPRKKGAPELVIPTGVIYRWHYMRCPKCELVFHVPGTERKPMTCDVCNVPMEEW